MFLVGSLSGCAIGVKEKNNIIYVSYSDVPAACQGAIKIATNKAIPVTIEGEKSTSAKMNLGGYYVVSAADLAGFIDAVQKTQKR